MWGVITILLVIVSILAEGSLVTWLLRVYAEKRIQKRILVWVWIGWFLAFSIVFLIPLDISSTRHEDCRSADPADCLDLKIESSVLVVTWRFLYWSTYILCWAVFPVMQSYVLAAHFTFLERFLQALKENLLFYFFAGVLGVILMLWLVIKSHFGKEELYGIAIASSNAFGLFMIICLLSYGLIEIPKKIWRRSNRGLTLKYLQFEAVGRLSDLQKAKSELDDSLKRVKKHEERIPKDDPYRPELETILSKCPPELYNNVTRGEGDFELSNSKLVALHYRVMRAVLGYNSARSVYEDLLDNAFKLEDILNSKTNEYKQMKWSFRARDNPNKKFLYQLEWIWFTYLETKALKLLGILCSLMSLCVVWSETLFWVPGYNFSVFYWLIAGVGDSANIFIQWIFVFIPVGYIAYCTFWSLFNLRIFNYYRILPHHSDANSLLFSCYYVCRLAAPLVYNYLLVINDEQSAFFEVMGAMELTPLLGTSFNLYFPMILIVLCAANLADLYTRLAGICCFERCKRFVYSEDFSDQKIDQGKAIIANEKKLKLAGRGLSIDQAVQYSPSVKKGGKKSRFGFLNVLKKRNEDEDADDIELLPNRNGQV